MKTEQIQMTLLYDEYGALLTDKQRDCFELYFHQDLSLGEIATELGISRQGVHDTLTRAEQALTEFERALGNVAHAQKARETLTELSRCAALLAENEDESVRSLAARITTLAQSLS